MCWFSVFVFFLPLTTSSYFLFLLLSSLSCSHHSQTHIGFFFLPLADFRGTILSHGLFVVFLIPSRGLILYGSSLFLHLQPPPPFPVLPFLLKHFLSSTFLSRSFSLSLSVSLSLCLSLFVWCSQKGKEK